MPTTNLPVETDGVQSSLQYFIPSSTPEPILQKILFTFWYIWKARNDYHFNRKQWTAAQVHHAAAAHMASHNQALLPEQPNSDQAINQDAQVQQDGSHEVITSSTQQPSQQDHNEQGHSMRHTPPSAMIQGINNFCVGTISSDQESQHHLATVHSIQEATLQPHSHEAPSGSFQEQVQNPNLMHRLTVRHPVLPQGTICYSDASIVPDSVSSMPRPAGIGIFIVNMQVQPPLKLQVNATLSDASSVIMAEAAGLAIAANIAQLMNLQHINFFTDNQELVSFFNGADKSNPPDWRIKTYTQLFINHTSSRSTGVFKISRELNLIAHNLAQQASQHPHHSSWSCIHVPQCPIMAMLLSLAINNVRILTAICC
jgi:hypothetical protein